MLCRSHIVCILCDIVCDIALYAISHISDIVCDIALYAISYTMLLMLALPSLLRDLCEGCGGGVRR